MRSNVPQVRAAKADDLLTAEQPPILVVGGGGSLGGGVAAADGAPLSEASAMASAMATEWGLSHLPTRSHDEAVGMGGEASALLLEGILEHHKRGQRCVLSACSLSCRRQN